MNDNPPTPNRDTFSAFRDFCSKAAYRLRKGAEEYGDKSFSKDPEVLIQELREECLDLATWGFILYERLRRMEEALQSTGQE